MSLSKNIKICGRCSSPFDCNTLDISNCQCNISIGRSTQIFLSKTKYDCLCANCLLEIDQLIHSSLQYPFPQTKEDYLEGIHYYKEGKNWVFTELYHIAKGHCCQNGCRHCPYGYKN
ncbi:MAG: DUF5522 domain-containing protein [Chitinophagales bacterium]|nr:DUF5522 domain-containing protein [Chitinophagales bacterium]